MNRCEYSSHMPDLIKKRRSYRTSGHREVLQIWQFANMFQAFWPNRAKNGLYPHLLSRRIIRKETALKSEKNRASDDFSTDFRLSAQWGQLEWSDSARNA